MNWPCTLCGSRDWPDPHTTCPLCRTETMTADTITIRQIEDVLTLARVLVDRTERMLEDIEEGDVSTAEAAEKISNMIEDITNAAKP